MVLLKLFLLGFVDGFKEKIRRFLELTKTEKFRSYFSYVLRHKYFVAVELFKRGYYARGILHDLSKFSPSEFKAYMNFFWMKKQRDSTGYYKPEDTGYPDFDAAWFHHQKKNSHHWQYWIQPVDSENFSVVAKTKTLEMPHEDRVEMLCDWIGAGRAQGTPGVNTWYLSNGHKLVLHENTRNWLETEIELLYGLVNVEGI